MIVNLEGKFAVKNDTRPLATEIERGKGAQVS